MILEHADHGLEQESFARIATGGNMVEEAPALVERRRGTNYPVPSGRSPPSSQRGLQLGPLM
jgi:hypothetical protein